MDGAISQGDTDFSVPIGDVFFCSKKSQDQKRLKAFLSHEQKLSQTGAASLKYAKRLLKKIAQGKTFGVTVNLWSKALMLVAQEFPKSLALQRDFYRMLEQVPFLRRLMLKAVFAAEEINVASFPAVQAAITWLRNYTHQENSQNFIYNFFTQCSTSVGNLSGLALHKFIDDPNVAQVIFADEALFDKFLQSPLTAEEISKGMREEDKIIARLLKLIAQTPIRVKSLFEMELELLFGGEESDYFLALFNRITSKHQYLSKLLDSGLLAEANGRNWDESPSSIVTEAIRKIRHYFYDVNRCAQLTRFLKGCPQAFLQLAGDQGGAVVDLLAPESPLSLLRYFSLKNKDYAAKFHKLMSDNAVSIAVDFQQRFPKHFDQLLQLGIGKTTFGAQLLHKMREVGKSPRVEQLVPLLINSSLTKRLQLTSDDCRGFLQQQSPVVELALASNEVLWRQFGHSLVGTFFTARNTAISKLKKIADNPASANIFESLVIAGDPVLWKKVKPQQNWWQKLLGSRKKFTAREEHFRQNNIFVQRLNFSGATNQLLPTLMSAAITQLMDQLRQCNRQNTVECFNIMRFLLMLNDEQVWRPIIAAQELMNKITIEQWLDLLLPEGDIGSRFFALCSVEFKMALVTAAYRSGRDNSKQCIEFKEKLGAQILDELMGLSPAHRMAKKNLDKVVLLVKLNVKKITNALCEAKWKRDNGAGEKVIDFYLQDGKCRESLYSAAIARGNELFIDKMGGVIVVPEEQFALHKSRQRVSPGANPNAMFYQASTGGDVAQIDLGAAATCTCPM